MPYTIYPRFLLKFCSSHIHSSHIHFFIQASTSHIQTMLRHANSLLPCKSDQVIVIMLLSIFSTPHDDLGVRLAIRGLSNSHGSSFDWPINLDHTCGTLLAGIPGDTHRHPDYNQGLLTTSPVVACSSARLIWIRASLCPMSSSKQYSASYGYMCMPSRTSVAQQSSAAELGSQRGRLFITAEMKIAPPRSGTNLRVRNQPHIETTPLVMHVTETYMIILTTLRTRHEFVDAPYSDTSPLNIELRLFHQAAVPCLDLRFLDNDLNRRCGVPKLIGRSDEILLHARNWCNSGRTNISYEGWCCYITTVDASVLVCA